MSARWQAALVFVAFIAVGGWMQTCGTVDAIRRQSSKTADSLTAISDAALHTVDTLKASHAQREVRWAGQNDSLRGVITKANQRFALVRVSADTVHVPVETFVYLTDTLVPACERCAARNDSIIAANRIERLARDAAESALTSENDYLRRELAQKQKRPWIEKWWPAVMIGSAAAGAWIRGAQ